MGSIENTSFEWRDRNDVYSKVEQMTTTHLFYTLRMIWNHTVPNHRKLKPYNSYDFRAFYTKEYLFRAVFCMTYELSTRADLPYKLQQELDVMRAA